MVDTLSQIRQIPSSGEALAYFYCKRDAAGPSDPAKVLRSIAKQLSSTRCTPDLHVSLVAAYEANRRSGAKLGIRKCVSLITSLVDINRHTTIVIDAFDDCGGGVNKQEFIHLLQEIVVKSAGLLKIFVSTRNNGMELESNIIVMEDNNRDDIEHFINTEVVRGITEGRLLLDADLAGLVISTLLEKARGRFVPSTVFFVLEIILLIFPLKNSFLWASIQIKELHDLTGDDVRKRLAILPETLDQTYERIYERVLSQKGSLVKHVLKLVMGSCQPLSPNKLFAIVTSQAVSITEAELGALLQNCRNLLEVDNVHNAIRFAHPSVREFFDRQTSFDILSVNAMAAEFCLSTLINPRNWALGNQSSGSASASDQEMREFVEYSTLHWITHVQRCSDQSNHKLWDMLKTFLGSFSECGEAYNSWYWRATALKRHQPDRVRDFPIYDVIDRLDSYLAEPLPPSFLALFCGFGEQIKDLWESKSWDTNARTRLAESLLSLASGRGYDWIVNTLVESGADVNVRCGHDGYALQAAAYGGHERVVEVLLKRGAEVNTQHGDYENALQAAAYGGHKQVVEKLLDGDAEVNALGGIYGNALQAAAYGGHKDVVEILLKRGARVNAPGGLYGNALLAAAYRGHKRVVEILLEGGADVNALGVLHGDDRQGSTCEWARQAVTYRYALQAAAYAGYEQVVGVLLKSGANINAQGGDHYANALAAAASAGHKQVVETLLDGGADVNAQGGYYGNPLQEAARGGHEQVVEKLLRSGAEVNAQGGLYGNALQAAAWNGQEQVVETLLDGGADVNAQGGFYGNALEAAANRRHEQVVEILLRRGAHINAQSSRGGSDNGSALQAAALCGHEQMVEILLKNGATVNAQGGKFGYALAAAATCGHMKVVEILLKAGADVNAQGGEFGNALQAAASSVEEQEQVVEVLLKEGANATAQGGHFGNALQAAAHGGYERVLEILLKRGAEVNTQGGHYGNALQAAAAGRHEHMVEVLLEKGALVNAQGGYYGNALQAAAHRGHEQVVGILLKKGADVNAQGGRYTTALRAAFQGQRMNVLRTLRKNGAVGDMADLFAEHSVSRCTRLTASASTKCQ